MVRASTPLPHNHNQRLDHQTVSMTSILLVLLQRHSTHCLLENGQHRSAPITTLPSCPNVNIILLPLSLIVFCCLPATCAVYTTDS